MKIISIMDNFRGRLFRRLGGRGTIALIGVLILVAGVYFKLAYDDRQFNSKIAVLRDAKALANDEQYELAYQEFNKLSTGDEFKSYPNLQAEAMFRAAHTLQMLDRYDEALDHYSNFMTQFPDSQWVENALYARGLCYDSLQNYEASRVSFTECLNRFPNSQFKDSIQIFLKESLLRDAKALANDEQYELAYQEFNKLSTGDEFKSYPDLQAEAMFRAAHTLQMLDRYDEALDHYSNFMTQFPDSQWVENALYARGLCYDSLQNYEASRVSFTECLNRFPNSQFKDSIQIFLKESLLRDAKALANDEQYELAYQEFNKLSTGDEFKSYPDLQAEAMFRAAHTLQMLDRYDEALDHYSNFMTQFPDSQWVENALYARGLCYDSLQNYEASREVLKKLLAEYPSSTFKDSVQRLLEKSFLKEPQVLLVEENYKLAYQEFNRLATSEEFKDYPDLQTEARSKATYSFLKQVGKDDEKLIPYIDFLTESSETEFVEDNALFNIGILSFQLQSYEASLSAFEQLRENVSDSALKEKALYNIGIANYRLQNYEDSRSALTEFLSEFPNSALKENVLYYKGKANYNLQDYEDSRSDFRELLISFPKSELKDDAKRFIAQAFLEETKLLLNLKKYELAYQEFDKLIATGKLKNYSNLQAEAMYRIAYSLKQLGLEKGNKAFEVRRLGRDDQAKAYNDQAILHNAEAFNRYTSFIKHFPENQYVARAYIDLGNIYLRQNEYRNARTKYEEALKRTEDLDLQAEIQFFIGLTYYDEGDFENAISADTSLLEEHPESDFAVKTKLRIADSYFCLQQWIEAINAYNRLIEEHEHEEVKIYIPSCYYQIGEAYYKLATSHENADEAEFTTGYFAKALRWYQKILDDFPTDEVAPHALYGAMWSLNALERKDELEHAALERVFSEFIHITGDIPDMGKGFSDFATALVDYRSGLIYQDKLSRTGKALEVFQTLVSNYGKSENGGIACLVADAHIRLSELSKQLGHSSDTVAEGKTHRQIEKRAFGSTVLLEVVDAENRRVGVGSGFFVRPGLIATNFHVVKSVTRDSAKRVYAKLIGQERKYLIQGYTAVDKERDLVVLKVANVSALPLPLGDSKMVHSGDPVYAMGNPGLPWRGEVIPLEGTFTGGIISALPQMRGNRWLQFDASISGGNSGGPLLDSKGEVIGIVTAKYGEIDDANLATPSEYLSTLLNKMGPPKPLWQVGLAK